VRGAADALDARVGLVVGGLLLLAVLVRLTTLGGRDRRRPRRGRGPVGDDGACEPSQILWGAPRVDQVVTWLMRCGRRYRSP
jgi:hypothetical protein